MGGLATAGAISSASGTTCSGALVPQPPEQLVLPDQHIHRPTGDGLARDDVCTGPDN